MARREPKRIKGTAAAKAEAPPTIGALRQRVAEEGRPTPDTVLRDLEAAKHLAVDHVNVTAMTRAIELQGKAVGSFREPDPRPYREFSNEELIEGIAKGDAVFAAKLDECLNGWASPHPDPSESSA